MVQIFLDNLLSWKHQQQLSQSIAQIYYSLTTLKIVQAKFCFDCGVLHLISLIQHSIQATVWNMLVQLGKSENVFWIFTFKKIGIKDEDCT